jgi:hypothetical protein
MGQEVRVVWISASFPDSTNPTQDQDTPLMEDRFIPKLLLHLQHVGQGIEVP